MPPRRADPRRVAGLMAEVAVIGGGLVGAAIAYGLACRGRDVLLLDGEDRDFRAARGNFGLIWVQSKGDGALAYQRWTLDAADAWPDFAETLQRHSGVDPGHRQPGGAHLCLSEAEYEQRAQLMARLQAQAPDRFRYQMLRHNELAARLPGLGADVIGGSYTPMDGDCDPLALLTALHRALLAMGGRIRGSCRIQRIDPGATGFRLRGEALDIPAEKVVIAAGLGGPELAQALGIDVRITPLRGQIMVTERLPLLLPMPTTSLRQTAQGGLQIGDSQEAAGFDAGTSLGVMQAMADRARRSFPALAQARILRAWGALRVMTADGLPVYAQSSAHPGAYYATCHSGVTLAPNHAGAVAAWIDGGGPAPDQAFAPDRAGLRPGGQHVPFT